MMDVASQRAMLRGTARAVKKVSFVQTGPAYHGASSRAVLVKTKHVPKLGAKTYAQTSHAMMEPFVMVVSVARTRVRLSGVLKASDAYRPGVSPTHVRESTVARTVFAAMVSVFSAVRMLLVRRLKRVSTACVRTQAVGLLGVRKMARFALITFALTTHATKLTV
ncbi:MAG: hypothetical protein CMH52_09790 [Myxococcales bacterium]|nr:hypothetical protein [Myxococcales bacterium]